MDLYDARGGKGKLLHESDSHCSENHISTALKLDVLPALM